MNNNQTINFSSDIISDKNEKKEDNNNKIKYVDYTEVQNNNIQIQTNKIQNKSSKTDKIILKKAVKIWTGMWCGSFIAALSISPVAQEIEVSSMIIVLAIGTAVGGFIGYEVFKSIENVFNLLSKKILKIK